MTLPLDPEYHSARLLMLIDSIASRSGSLDGLTKLAKLDFLVRYPLMLRQLLTSDAVDISEIDGTDVLPSGNTVESRMIRYKYGPWDNLYYPLIGALVSRGLVESTEGRGRLALRPTARGREVAAALRESSSWVGVAARCELVANYYNLSGNALKDRIYSDLPEVVDRPVRGVI